MELSLLKLGCLPYSSRDSKENTQMLLINMFKWWQNEWFNGIWWSRLCFWWSRLCSTKLNLLISRHYKILWGFYSKGLIRLFHWKLLILPNLCYFNCIKRISAAELALWLASYVQIQIILSAISYTGRHIFSQAMVLKSKQPHIADFG